MSGAGAAIRALTRTLGTAYLLAQLQRERGVPDLPLAEIQRRRDARVRRLVRYAAATVPHYRELFRSHGLDPRQIKTAADLQRLPLLDKATVRAEPRRFVAQSARARRSVKLTTSGSTGMPLAVYHDPLSLLTNLAYSEPEKAVIRAAAGPERPLRQVTILYSRNTVKAIQAFYGRVVFRPRRLHERHIDIERPLGEVVGLLKTFRPQVLVSYGSYVETLFRMADAGIITFPPPRVVMYGADTMTEPGRQLIEERFRVRVLSVYNAVECLRIAFTCEHGRGYHIREDLCHLRLVDRQGQDVADGEPGDVVISNLVNHGTVLLNYRLGDVAVRSHEPCPCGLSLPRLTGLEGRADDVLVLAANRIVSPRAVWGVLKPHPEILRYQLVQHEPDCFECRLQTRDRADFERLPGELEPQLRALLGPVRLDFAWTSEFATEPGGKFRAVLSLCGARLRA
jgi:phenylacetate-CoA ligase